MKNIGINMNTFKDKDGEILKFVSNIIYNDIKDCNIRIFRDSNGLIAQNLKDVDLLVVLGGDGTILSTARSLKENQIPILGVNIGNLGFLTAIESTCIKKAIEEISLGKYIIEERDMLTCTLSDSKKNKTFYALNDIVVSKGTLSRIIDYDIDIDGFHYASFAADGVIIATPTGSTAYSLSAGGPIISPELNVMSITPICPHSIGMRTLIVSSKSSVMVKPCYHFDKAFLTMDGQESMELKPENEILIGTADWKCKLIRLEDYNYFNVLQEKIIWKTNRMGR